MSRSAVVAHGVPLPYSWLDIVEFEHRRVAAWLERGRRQRAPAAVSTISVLSAVPPSPVRLIDAVGGVGLVVVVGDVHQRHAVVLGQSGQHRHQRVAAILVDHAGDLVGDQQRRLAGQRRGHREALQLAAGQAAGVAFGEAVEADLGEQLVHVGGGARRQPPDDVVGDPGAEHLALRVLQDRPRCRRAGRARRRRAGRRCPTVGSRPASISISVVLPEPLAPGDGDVFAGFDAQRHRAERVVVGARIAESDVGEPQRARARRAGVGRRSRACAHRGSPSEPGDHPRQRPPADAA